MSDWAPLLQWGGWAAACTLTGALVTAYWQRRTAREQMVVQAHAVEVTAEDVRTKARTADADLQEMATRTYQGLVAALKSRIDDLESRITLLETREKTCLERLAAVEEERRRDQAEFWRRRETRE